MSPNNAANIIGQITQESFMNIKQGDIATKIMTQVEGITGVLSQAKSHTGKRAMIMGFMKNAIKSTNIRRAINDMANMHGIFYDKMISKLEEKYKSIDAENKTITEEAQYNEDIDKKVVDIERKVITEIKETAKQKLLKRAISKGLNKLHKRTTGRLIAKAESKLDNTILAHHKSKAQKLLNSGEELSKSQERFLSRMVAIDKNGKPLSVEDRGDRLELCNDILGGIKGVNGEVNIPELENSKNPTEDYNNLTDEQKQTAKVVYSNGKCFLLSHQKKRTALKVHLRKKMGDRASNLARSLINNTNGLKSLVEKIDSFLNERTVVKLALEMQEKKDNLDSRIYNKLQNINNKISNENSELTTGKEIDKIFKKEDKVGQILVINEELMNATDKELKKYADKSDRKFIDNTQEIYRQGNIALANKREILLETWLNYSSLGLERLLNLRLQNLNAAKRLDISNISVLPYLSKGVSAPGNAPHFVKDFHDITTDDSRLLAPFLLFESMYVYHWVAMIVEKDGNELKLNYLNSENQAIPSWLKEELITQLQPLDAQYYSSYKQVPLEQQRYNNCGSEVIENFILYLTGTRATQEGALPLHSLLYENDLIFNSEEYRINPYECERRIEKNNKLIGILSNQVMLDIGGAELIKAPLSHSSNLQVVDRVNIGAAIEDLELIIEKNYQYLYTKTTIRAESTEIEGRISDKSSALVQPNYESSQESYNQFILIGEQAKVDIAINNKQEHSVVALIAEGVEEGIVPVTTLVITDTNGHSRSYNAGISSKSGFIGYLANLAEEFVTSVSSSAMNIGNTMTNAVMKNEYIKGKILNYVYYEEVVGVNSVIGKQYVQESTNNGAQEVLQKHPFTWDKKDFKKLKLVVHPDKGGNAEDFRAINEFEDQIGKTERIYENIYNKLAEKLQPKIQKVSVYAKGADVGIDLAKVYLKPNVENVLNTIYDGIVLYNKVSPNVFGASVVMVTTPITSLYNLYQGDYEKAGIQGINGLSYYMLNSKYLPGYGLHAYAGLNGITIVYDIYKGEHLEAVLQTVGIAGMIFAPTLTGAYYAIRYTYNNAHGLYQLYQSKQQENILGFTSIIARLLVKTINDNIHDEVIQNILRSISLDQRLEEAGIKEEVAIMSNEYNEREDTDLISLEDIAEYLKDKNKVVIRQINNLDATKLIKEKVDKLTNEGGVLNYLKEYVGYTSDGISETKRVESIKLEIIQLLGKKDVNYDEVEAIIKNAIDVIKSKYLSNLYDSTVNNEVLKVLKEIEEEVLIVRDKEREEGSKEYYTEEVSRMIV
jgi:hypothetical protein